MMAKKRKGNQPRGFICCECADTSGGEWLHKDHVATWHTGKCDFCGEKRSLANCNDYRWPDGRCGEWD